MSAFRKMRGRIATYGVIGGLFGGAGGVGLFGACHTVCQVTIGALAAVGITGIGMPFAFLDNPWIIAISWTVSGISVIGAIMYWRQYRRRCSKRPSIGHLDENKNR